MALTKNDETESDDDKTIVESPTPAPETVSTNVVALTKREEFVRLFIATVFTAKDAAIERFTVESMKELVACTKLYMALVRDATLQFATFFVKLMNDLRASNTAPNV